MCVYNGVVSNSGDDVMIDLMSLLNPLQNQRRQVFNLEAYNPNTASVEGMHYNLKLRKWACYSMSSCEHVHVYGNVHIRTCM